MSKLHTYLAFSLLWLFPVAWSQLPHGGKPYPYNTIKSSIKPIVLSGFNMQKAIDESLSSDAVSGKKPFKFAWNYSLDLSPENSGTWAETSDGTRIWRIHLVSPGAFGVNVDFSQYQLEPGCMLFIYPPSQEYFLGGFNFINNNENQTLPTEFLEGEEIVLELQIKPGIKDYGSLRIGSLAHAYINYSASSGPCNIDINCPEGKDWQVIKKAVCKISFKQGTSTEYCTGTLINNTRFDTIPYLLTANHCIRNATQAASAVFYFDYETDTCGKRYISKTYTLAGSTLMATSDSIDFTLLKLNESPPYSKKPYFAGWSISKTPATYSVCIHHPEADVKKISIEKDQLTGEYQDPIPPNLSWLTDESLPNVFWRVIEWESGTTEGGSSGAPLFNQNKLIVANLTGGEADCNKPVNDYFSKIFVAWDYYTQYTKQLKHWLDPESTGINNLVGFNPFGVPDTIPIDTTEYSERFTVFPNPATGLVTFETDSLDISGGYLSIYTNIGKKMARFDIIETKRLTFDVSFLEQGLYILEFSKGDILQRKRLVVINP
jgi:hypothetical protein